MTSFQRYVEHTQPSWDQFQEAWTDWLWCGGKNKQGQTNPGMPQKNDPRQLPLQPLSQGQDPNQAGAGALQWLSPTKQAMSNVNQGLKALQNDKGAQRVYAKFPKVGQQLQAVQQSWSSFVMSAKQAMQQVNAATPKAGRNMGDMGNVMSNGSHRNLPLTGY